MATSGVSNYNPEFDDILQDAAAMVGGGPILAEELTAAMRGMNILLTRIQNKNVLLHKIETTSISVSVSQGQYELDNTVLDVLSISNRLDTADLVLERHGYQRWAEIPAKTQAGRPTSYWFDRRRDTCLLNVWPLPDDSYTLIVTLQKNAEEVIRAFNQIDVPRRFIPALIFGLAYWIGLRRNSCVPTERLALLKAEYDAAVTEAMGEDRERGSVFLRIGRRH